MTKEELIKLFEQINKTIHSADDQLLNEINIQNIYLKEKIKNTYQKKYKIELSEISKHLDELFEEIFRNSTDKSLTKEAADITIKLNQLIDNL